MKTINYDNHIIEIPGMRFSTTEEIKYDGKVVSSKQSMTGATHIFKVFEDGVGVNFEVEIGTNWHGFSSWCTVRRNGIIIFTDR